MNNNSIPYHQPVDSASPINGTPSIEQPGEKQRLLHTIQRQASDIVLLQREVSRLKANLRDVNSKVDQIVNTLRKST